MLLRVEWQRNLIIVVFLIAFLVDFVSRGFIKASVSLLQINASLAVSYVYVTFVTLTISDLGPVIPNKKSQGYVNKRRVSEYLAKYKALFEAW